MPRIFADLKVGDTLPAMRAVVTQEWVDHDSTFKNDDNPWYRGPSPFGGPVALPTLTNADFDRFLRANDFLMSGIIPSKTDHQYLEPVMVGTPIVTTCTVVEAFERKGRNYVTFEFITSDEAGRVLVKKRDTLLQMAQAVQEG